MRTNTRCDLPSPELIVTRTARNAGAETVCGLSLPPETIVKVAGTRAFVLPPPVALDPPLDPLDPPEPPDPPMTPASPLARVDGALARDFEAPLFAAVVLEAVVDAGLAAVL